MIPAGSDIFLEIHYTPMENKVRIKRRSGCPGEGASGTQMLNLVLYETRFEIPPNVSNHPGNMWAILNEPVTLVYMQPHLHMRGTKMDIKVTYPDGRSEMLVRVPRYNYQWQVIYVQEKPLKLPKGTRIDVSASWDNSANNKFNPDPFLTVRPGQQSWDEMLVAILGVTVDRNVDPGKIMSMGWQAVQAP